MVGLIQLASEDAKKADGKMRANAKEFGAAGTYLTSGMIAEDFNAQLQFPQSIAIFEEMSKSDGQVNAAVQAIKLPLMTANWMVEGNENVKEEHIEFIQNALFEDMDVEFDHFLSEALQHIVYGFYYFEKIFKQRADGMIGWKKFAPRIPSAHYKWSADKFKKGGITQQLKTTDQESPDKTMNPQIPWSKLMLFNNQQEGDNYEGISPLRSAYKHWKMKDLAYKIQIIAIERHGVGIPTMTLPKGAGDDDITKAEEMLKNLRSNEKGYMILKEGWSFEIISGGTGGTSKDSQIHDAIEHHNRMILMNVLAPFLDLGSGATGSFALGETQLNFFLNSLQQVGKNVAGTINESIKELIDINFGIQEHYPTLRVTEIGNVDKQVLMTALSAAVTSGLIVIDQPLKEWVREMLNLPEIDEATAEIPESVIPEEKKPFEKKPEIKPKDETKKDIEEIKKKLAELTKKKIYKLAEKPKVDISKSERIFQRAITEHERGIEEWWQKTYLPEIERTENKLRDFLEKKYRQAKVEVVGGVVTIATRGNAGLAAEMRRGIDEEMNRLHDKFKQKNYVDAMMKQSAKQALKVMLEMKTIREFADTVIDEQQFRAFTSGHLSNVNGFIFNEGRQLKERLLDNFTQKTSITIALDQTKKFTMNRNITKLSIVTHPRALFKNVVFVNADKQGVIHFKITIPDNKYNDLNPMGITAGLLFLIFTYQQLNKKGDTKNNANVIGGMGAHYGSFDYCYPIDEEYYEEEERIAREQRKAFLNSVK